MDGWRCYFSAIHSVARLLVGYAKLPAGVNSSDSSDADFCYGSKS